MNVCFFTFAAHTHAVTGLVVTQKDQNELNKVHHNTGCCWLLRACFLAGLAAEFHQKMMVPMMMLLPAATDTQVDKVIPDLCSVYPHVW